MMSKPCLICFVISVKKEPDEWQADQLYDWLLHRAAAQNIELKPNTTAFYPKN